MKNRVKYDAEHRVDDVMYMALDQREATLFFSVGARACEECTTACLQEPDVQARIHCIQILNDCAKICLQAVALMSRNSAMTK